MLRKYRCQILHGVVKVPADKVTCPRHGTREDQTGDFSVTQGMRNTQHPDTQNPSELEKLDQQLKEYRKEQEKEKEGKFTKQS